MCFYDYRSPLVNLFNGTEFDLGNKAVKVRVQNTTRIIKYQEFLENPYLLHYLQSYDAAKVGIFAMDFVIGGYGAR